MGVHSPAALQVASSPGVPAPRAPRRKPGRLKRTWLRFKRVATCSCVATKDPPLQGVPLEPGEAVVSTAPSGDAPVLVGSGQAAAHASAAGWAHEAGRQHSPPHVMLGHAPLRRPTGHAVPTRPSYVGSVDDEWHDAVSLMSNPSYMSSILSETPRAAAASGHSHSAGSSAGPAPEGGHSAKPDAQMLTEPAIVMPAAAPPQPPGTPPLPRRQLTPQQPTTPRADGAMVVLAPAALGAAASGGLLPVGTPRLSSDVGVVPRAAPLELGLEPDLPVWVPPKVVPGIDPATRFVPVPAHTGLGGYWAKVPERSAPIPMPIDVALKASRMARNVHESIKGILLRDSDSELVIKARVTLPLGVKFTHQEHYPKDGSAHSTVFRRDLRPGRSMTRMYWTEEGAALLVCESSDLSGRVDHIGYELIRVIEEGELLQCRQWVLVTQTGEMVEQAFVGRRDKLPAK